MSFFPFFVKTCVLEVHIIKRDEASLGREKQGGFSSLNSVFYELVQKFVHLVDASEFKRGNPMLIWQRENLVSFLSDHVVYDLPG